MSELKCPVCGGKPEVRCRKLVLVANANNVDRCQVVTCQAHQEEHESGPGHVRSAYTPVTAPDCIQLGRADEGTKGYTPCPQLGSWKTWGEAEKVAGQLNKQMGLSEHDAFMIVVGTMRK